MKKITLLLMTVVFSFSLKAQLALEGFEGAAFPPAGWAIMDNGVGTVNSWTRINAPVGNVYEGTWSAFMTRENIGFGNTSQDWLVTPQINVPTNGQLRFFARSTLAGNQGTLYQIRVSTNADQMAQGDYIIVQQYTENELSEIYDVYEEKLVSLAAFQGQQIYIAFVMQFTQPTTALGGDRWLLDNVEVVEQCLDPENLNASSISQTGATLSWDNPGGAPQFEVEVVQVPNAPTGTGVLTNDNPVTTAQLGLTLLESTEYEFYVRAVCSESNSLWIGPFTFTTRSPGETCSAPIQVTSLPYFTTDNTENYGNDVSGSPGPSGCGTNSAYLNGNDVFYEYTATFTGTIQISMTPDGTWSGLFVYNSCANIGVSCIAGVANAQTTPRIIELPVTEGSTYHIVISTWAPPASVGYNLSIQQVNCPPPTSLAATMVDDLNFQLSWNNNGATQFEVEVVALPGTPTGTGILTTSNPVTTADLGITLQPNTQYQFYVRADCDNGTFSLWPPPRSFSTVLGEACSAPINVTSLPYTTTDNTENYGNTVTGAPGAGCGSTSAFLTGNEVFYSYTPQNTGIIEITLTPNAIRSGLFVYNSCANVGVSCVAGVANTAQTPRVIQLPVTAGVTYYIVVSSWPAPQTIGYTLVIQQVNCAPPTGLSVSSIGQNSANLSWNNPSGASSWEVAVQPQGTGLPMGSGVTTTTNVNYNATGLNPATSYEYYVRADCGNGTFSAWAGPFNFLTTQVPATLNYSEDFEGVHGWSLNNGTQVNKWIVGSAVSNGGTNSLYITNDNGVSNAYTISTAAVVHAFRDIQIPADTGEISLSFDWRGFGENNFDYIRAWLVPVTFNPTPGTQITAANSGGGTQLGGNFSGQPNWVTETFTIPVSAFAGQVRRLVFEWRNDAIIGTQPAGAIDNVNIAVVTCPRPTNLNATNLAEDGATLTWTETGSATQWEVIVLPAGSPAPGAGATGTIVSNPSFVVSGLPSGTSFVFYVRAICGDDDISFWAGPRQFATLITNDECVNAITVPVNPDTLCGQVVSGTVIGATASPQPNACVGTADDDVWFQFVAQATTHTIDLINVSGSTTDLVHAVYSGDNCGSLTQISCSDPNQSVINNLVPGQTYYIRVYTWTATPNQTTTFNVCIGTIAPPISVSTSLYTVPQLIEDVLINSTCALVSNINWSTSTNFGHTQSGIGYFNQNGSGFPFEDGIILSSGYVSAAPGPKGPIQSAGASPTWPGDPDIQALMNSIGTGQAQNASWIEFDFVPLTDFISFDFIFASEEYGTFQCSQTFTDAFGFFLTNIGTGVTTNLAVVPDTTTPISVFTIKDNAHNTTCPSSFPEYFGNYYGLPTGLNPIGAPINFRGHTIPMTAAASVIPNEPYKIKLVIADRSDWQYDSAVFLKGSSFDIGDIDLGDDLLIAQGNALCPGGTTLLESGLNPALFSFEWFLNGNPIPDANEPNLIVNQPGEYTLLVQYNNTDCSSSDTITVEYFEDLIAGTPQDLYFCSATGFGTFDLTLNDDLINEPFGGGFNIAYFLTQADADANTNPIINTTGFANTVNPQTIYARAFPVDGECFATTSFQLIVEDLTPEFSITEDFGLCDGSTDFIVITPINYDESSPVTYSWTLDGAPLTATTSTLEVTTAGTYEVIADFGGCTNTATVVVTLVDYFIPVLDFSYTTPVCSNDEVNPTPIVSSEFTTGGVFSSTEGLIINPETGEIDLASLPGTYEVTYTYTLEEGECGESGSFTTIISILPAGLIVTDFTYDTPVCLLGDNPLPIPAENFSPGGLFSITGGLTINPATGEIELEGASAGDYIVTYTIPSSDCTEETISNFTITLTDIFTPIVEFSYTTPVCSNETVNPTPIEAVDFTTGGVFSSTEGLEIDPATGEIDLENSTPGTYEVTYTYTNEEGECGEDGLFTTTISILPAGLIVTDFTYDTPVCLLGDNPLPIPAENFSPGGLFSITGGLTINPATGEIELEGASAGDYIVTYTIPASDCTEETSSDFSITLTEIITPELGFTYASPVCSNASENPEPITIAGFAFGGVFSSTEGLEINPETGVIDLENSTPGTYTITYTYNPDVATCESPGETTATITITPAAVIVTDFTYPTPVCASSGPITPTGAEGFTSGGVFSSTSTDLIIDPTTGSINVVTSTPGTYEVTYEVDATECTEVQQSTFTVTINALSAPQLGFSYTTPVCSSDANPSPIFSDGFTQGGSFSSSTATVDPQTGVVDLTTPAGEHVITYTLAQNNDACTAAGSSTATIVINAAFIPETGFAYAPEYCFGDENDEPALAADFFPGGTFTATGGLTINAQTGEITLAGPGSYTVTYTVAPDPATCNLGGSSSFSFTVSAAIEVALEGECDGAAYFLTASPVSGSYNPEQASYVWRDAGGNQVGSNSPTFNVSTYVAGNPVLLPSSFSVTVSYNGCEGTQSFVVESVSCIIQRGISPNNDGDNDFFDLRGYNVRNLSIFNRYGRKVYSRASYSDQWIGQSDKGDELPDGTYFYVIDFADSESITGWIYINREQ